MPADLREAAEESQTPLWISPKRGHELLTYLQYHLARMLARQVTLHGVLMEVYSIGVLITGESGTGKSELALELITRGHRLVADDAPEFTLIAPDVIDGNCPDMLRDLLEVRGLGVLNVREMFGQTAVKPSKYLRLIVHLKPQKLDAARRRHGAPLPATSAIARCSTCRFRCITIPVAPGRNIAVLAEAAVRSHMLKSKGIRSGADLHRPPGAPDAPAAAMVDRAATPRQSRSLPPRRADHRQRHFPAPARPSRCARSKTSTITASTTCPAR